MDRKESEFLRRPGRFAHGQPNQAAPLDSVDRLNLPDNIRVLEVTYPVFMMRKESRKNPRDLVLVSNDRE